MSIPKPNYNPPFNVTRASHAVLTVKDLAKSRAFYVDLIGLIVSDEDKDAIYLRGVAEACHHCLVLKRAAAARRVRARRHALSSPRRISKRPRPISRRPVAGEMGGAAASGQDVACQRSGRRAARILRHHEREAATRHRVRAPSRRGAAAARPFPDSGAGRARATGILHGHGLPALRNTSRPTAATSRCSCSCSARAIRTTSCSRPALGPRLHHFAFSIPESYHFFYVCDLASDFGFAENIEYGPGRHGPGHALFVYLRDPDGHRIELFNTHYQMMDIENEPVRWDASMPASGAGNFRRARAGFTEASRFHRRRAARAGAQGQSDDAGEVCRRNLSILSSPVTHTLSPSGRGSSHQQAARCMRCLEFGLNEKS